MKRCIIVKCKTECIQNLGEIGLKKLYEKNMYLDPLTGLPNFFKLIESDVIQLFGNIGSVIICDMVKFSEINRKYGSDVGDIVLKKLAQTMAHCLSDYKDSSIFRTDGDEFTIILPDISTAEAELLSENIKDNFQNVVSHMRYGNIQMRLLTMPYSGITSISRYYQLIFKHTRDEVEQSEHNASSFVWTDHIIDSFTRRISETLAFYEDAYVLAMADDISGLPNHRAGNTFLSNLIEESKMKRECFSILFIDGDNLRRYNEISYHEGNMMIRNLSKIISASLRKNDRIFRWFTGDEFLVVLPGVDKDTAIRLAERTRSAVELQTVDWTFPVTISIGVAEFTNDGSSIDEIIGRAEKANSVAKTRGKNRVVPWSPAQDLMLG